VQAMGTSAAAPLAAGVAALYSAEHTQNRTPIPSSPKCVPPRSHRRIARAPGQRSHGAPASLAPLSPSFFP
jgi:hypothetical protein